MSNWSRYVPVPWVPGCRRWHVYDRILNQVKQEQSIWASLQQIELCKSHSIPISMKIPLMKALVWPVTMYGCESWTLRKNEETRFDAFDMKGLRTILRVLWTAKKTNEWILNKAWVAATAGAWPYSAVCVFWPVVHDRAVFVVVVHMICVLQQNYSKLWFNDVTVIVLKQCLSTVSKDSTAVINCKRRQKLWM